MLYDHTLATPGEQMIPLDEEALATIVGGDLIPTILRKFAEVVWDCVKTGIDDVIAGAEEGYADAQAS